MFEIIIVRPLLNILYFFYATIPGHDFGVAVILLTAAVRLLLWPLASSQLHSQKAMTKIQPEVKKIQEKYKNDPQKMNAAVMELYKEKEVNPFSSCLPLLLQLPILFGFFYVFRKFSNEAFVSGGYLNEIYPFIKNISWIKEFIATNLTINTTFLGIVDLAKPNIWLGVAAGVLQFVQSKMLMPKQEEKDAASMLTAQMTYLFPVLTVFIAITLPSALPLYWVVTTLFAILQQYLVMHRDIEILEESNGKPSKKS